LPNGEDQEESKASTITAGGDKKDKKKKKKKNTKTAIKIFKRKLSVDHLTLDVIMKNHNPKKIEQENER
jgi:hypothetical protein